MSADAFIVYYGLRWEVSLDDKEQLTRLEERRDPRQIAARQHKLKCWWGNTTDESRYFILVGSQIGRLGWEGESYIRLGDDEIGRFVADTRERLRAAGFTEEPAWHFQFEADR